MNSQPPLIVLFGALLLAALLGAVAGYVFRAIEINEVL